MHNRFTMLIVLFLVGLSIPIPAQGFQKPVGEVSWTGGYISGTGYGTAKPSGSRMRDQMAAVRAAEIGAYRALAESINGVSIDGTQTVRDAMEESTVRSRVEGLVRGAQKVSSEVTWEGSTPFATVEMRVCLNAESAACQASQSLATAVQENPEGDTLGDEVADYVSDPSEIKPDSSRPITGLIVHVPEGVDFERSLFPAVITFIGSDEIKRVYSVKNVKPEVVRTFGVVRYTDVVDDALKDERLGDNVLVCNARQVTGENHLVLGEEDARRVKESTFFGNDYLAEAKVTISGKH